MNIATDEVIRFAEQNSARDFATLGKKKLFRVKPELDGITFITHKGKSRVNSRKMIEKYVVIFNRQEGYKTIPFVAEGLHDASYFVSLVAEMLDKGDTDATIASATVDDGSGFGLELEVMRLLKKSTRRSDFAARDIELITFYYGFRRNPCPSQVDAQKTYGLKSRQRAEQIINESFIDKVKPEEFPSAVRIAEILEQEVHIAASSLLEKIRAAGLVEERPSARALLDFLNDGLHRCRNYQLFTPELEVATREKWGRSEEVYFIRDDVINELKQLRLRLRTMPGQLGIANFKYLEMEVGNFPAERRSFLRELITASPNSWTMDSEAGLWFLFEDRENRLVNFLEKVHTITPSCLVFELSEALTNALKARAAKPYEYPSRDVVETWLRQSALLDVRGDLANLERFEKRPLTPVEEDARMFLSKPENQPSALGPLRDWLESRGHNKATYIKAITNSAIVHVEKSEGRPHYSYRLIGQRLTAPMPEKPDETRYFAFRDRLRRIGEDGTDRAIVAKQRKEQDALQDWLFKEHAELACAICGRIFVTSALVAAHKKPRRICNQTERIDPHIVMPLCVFGCDFLYERSYIFVAAGIVETNPNSPVSQGTRECIRHVAGRRISPQWTQGLPSYFRRP